MVGVGVRETSIREVETLTGLMVKVRKDFYPSSLVKSKKNWSEINDSWQKVSFLKT